MKQLLMIIPALAIVFAVHAAPSEKEAQSSSESWLALVDDQKYAESWIEASSMFRSQVPQEK